jgi:hypothetical protein
MENEIVRRFVMWEIFIENVSFTEFVGVEVERLTNSNKNYPFILKFEDIIILSQKKSLSVNGEF